MNRNYKVIWNRSLGCFMAVAEYAKSRGKSSSSAVTSSSSASAAVSTGARLLRLSAICAGLAAAGLSMQANAGSDYVGDNGTPVIANDGELLRVIGGANTNNLSDNNIGVIGFDTDGNTNQDTLTIKLSRTLTGLTSANFGGIGGVTISTTGINNGDQQITGLASAGNVNDVTNANNAVNVTDLNDAIDANKVNYFSVNSTLGTNEDNLGAAGADSISIGKDASTSVSASRSVAMGNRASATGSESTALGAASQAFADSATAIGFGARADQYGATAIGTSSKAQGQYSSAFGQQAEATASGGVALGNGSKANALNSVALGQNSIAALQSGASFLTNVAADANNGTVSVGAVGSERRIINVAGGSADTDAVNVAQLRSVNTKADGNMTALGGSVNNAGGYVAPTYNVVSNPNNAATTPFTTVKGAVEQLSNAVQTPLTFAGDNGTNVTRKLGQTLNITGGETNPADLTTGNIGVIANGNNGLSVRLAEDIDLGNDGSVEIGTRGTFNSGSVLDRNGLVAGSNFDNTTVNRDGIFINEASFTGGFSFTSANFTADGLTISNGPSITRSGGINAANNKITNVLNGTVALNNKDAVNGGQLFETESRVTENRIISRGNMTALGGNVIAGTYVAPSYELNGGTFDNVDNALGNLDGRTSSNTTAIDDLASGTTGIVRENDEGALTVGSTASATGENSIAMGVGAVASGNSSISIGTGNTVIGNNSGAIGDPTIINGNNSYAVGNNNTLDGNRAFILGNENAITLGSNNSYALGNDNIVNGRRSFALGNSNEINSDNNFALGNNIIIGADLDGAVGIGNRSTVEASTEASYDPNGPTDIVAIGRGSNVVSVGNSTTRRRLTNVAAGGADTDAVNVSQLKAVDGKVNQGIKIGGDTGADQQLALGDTINVLGGSNLTTTADGNGITVDLNNTIDLTPAGSVTVGRTLVDDNGIKIIGTNNDVFLTRTGLFNGGNKIRGVTDGDVTANSRDAINGSQLFTTNTNVTENRVISQGNMTALGGSVNAGAYVAPSYVLNGGTFNNVGDALGNLDTRTVANSTAVQTPLTFAGDNGTPITRQLGDQLNIRGARTVANNAATTNISVTADGTDTLSVKLAENVNLGANGSVRMGTTGSGNVSTAVNSTGVSVVEGGLFGSTRSSATLNNNDLTFTSSVFGQSGPGTAILNSNGLNIVGGPQFTRNSISASGNKITNVQNGTVALNNKDAVNGGQLFNTSDAIKNVIGGNASNTNGIVTTTNIGNTGENTIDGAIGFNEANIAKGIIIGDGTGTTDQQLALGDTINVRGGSNLTTTASNTGITVDLDDEIVLTSAGSVTVGNSVLNATGLTVGVNELNGAGLTAGQTFVSSDGLNFVAGGGTSTVSVTRTGINAGGFAVEGVGAGIVDANSQQAVNGSQLFETNTMITNLTNGTTGIVRENDEGALTVGSTASATGENSIAMGVGAVASGNSSISIGTGNTVSGNNSGAIGDPTTITGNNSYSLGNDNTISGNRAFTVGNNNTISNNNSATLGNSNTISGNRSFALGNNNTVNSNNAFALGNDITIGTGLNGAVAIGNNTTVTASTIASFDPTGPTSIVGTATGSNVVSVGSAGGERRLTNVAAGGADTDAVNVSQLRAVDGKVNQGFNIGADNGLASDNVQLGETVNFTNTDGNLVATATDNGINYDLAPAITVNQVTIGNGTNDTILTTDARGLSVNQSKIVDILDGDITSTSQQAINGRQLNRTNTNVAGNMAALGGGAAYDAVTNVYTAPTYTLNNGANSFNNVGDALGNLDGRTTANTTNIATNANAISDLANGTTGIVQQIPNGTGNITVGAATGGTSVSFAGTEGDRVLTGVANGVADNDAVNVGQLNAQGNGVAGIIGGTTTYDPATGTFTNANIGGTQQSTIDGAINTIRQAAVEAKSTVSGGKNIVVTATPTTGGPINYEVTTADDLEVDSVKSDDGLGNVAEFNATGSSLTNTAGNTNNSTATGNTITNGTNVTTVTGSGTSVTNGNNTTNYGATGFSINNGVNTAVFNQAGVSFTDNVGAATGPSITAAGIDANNTRVTNVADGMAPRDAVNFGQLSGMESRLGNSINELGYRVDEVEDDANAGISAAMAMSSLPQSNIAGRSMVGGGIATYNGESAVAVGISRVSDNGRWVMKVNGTADTQGNAGGAIGAGFHF